MAETPTELARRALLATDRQAELLGECSDDLQAVKERVAVLWSTHEEERQKSSLRIALDKASPAAIGVFLCTPGIIVLIIVTALAVHYEPGIKDLAPIFKGAANGAVPPG